MAITRKRFKPEVMQPGVVFIAGRVAIGATGAVGAQTGKGFSVTRTGTGLYTITIDTSSVGGVNTTRGVPAILHAQLDIAPAAANATQYATVLTFAPTTGTLTVQTSTEATPNTAADPPSGSFLQVFLVVQNTIANG